MLNKNPFVTDDKLDREIPTATLQIYSFIDEYLHRPKDTHVNRASSAGACSRKRWYQRNGYEGEVMAPRAMVNFLLGDLSEKTMQYFVSKACVGPGKMYSEVDFGNEVGSFTFQGREIIVYSQPTYTADVGGTTVTNHVDGFGKRNADGQWELIEFKSAANYGYNNYKKEGPGDYLCQAHVGMRTNMAIELGINSVRFFCLRKETGHMWDSLHNFDQAIWDRVVKSYAEANQEDIPEPSYGFVDELFRKKPTGRKTVPWQCQYCPYLTECKGEPKMEFKKDQWGSYKPKYYFEEKK